jgi:tetratricopeptide (TPR) repeat protein
MDLNKKTFIERTFFYRRDFFSGRYLHLKLLRNFLLLSKFNRSAFTEKFRSLSSLICSRRIERAIFIAEVLHCKIVTIRKNFAIGMRNISESKILMRVKFFDSANRIFDRSEAKCGAARVWLFQTSPVFIILTSLIFINSIYSIDVDPEGSRIKEGVEKYSTKDFQGALENFSAAEKTMSEDERVAFNKGASYFKMNDFKTAQKYFEKSLGGNDKELKVKSLYNLGNTFAKLGDKKSALRSYRNSLAIDPDFLPSRKNIELLNQEKEDQKDKNKDSEDEKKKDEEKDSKDKKEESKKSNSKKEEKDSKNGKNKELTKEEAEKILEAMKEDKINRKKANAGQRDKDEIFW